MGLFGNLLTLPVLGVPRLVRGLAVGITEQALGELLDEGAVQAELLALEALYDGGQIDEAEHDRREETLIRRLREIREIKAREREGG